MDLLLDVTQPEALYFWQDGSVESTLKVTSPGTYSVEVERNRCLASDQIKILAGEVPTLELGADTTVCISESVLLRSPERDGIAIWSDGSKGRELTIDNAPGWYWLEWRETCSVRDSILINFKPCKAFDIYIPNAFSPDRNGINDKFRVFYPEFVQILEYRMEVYDRWGGKQFFSTNPDEGWDGRYGYKYVPKGIYVWTLKIRYRDDFGESTYFGNGDVFLMR